MHRTTSYGLAFSLLIVGCASQTVAFENRTETTQCVQVALPYPAPQMFASHERFQFCFGPGASWSSRTAATDDRFPLKIAMPNGSIVFRVVSADCQDRPWQTFTCDAIDTSTVTIAGAYPSYAITSSDASGREIAVTWTDVRWFSQ